VKEETEDQPTTMNAFELISLNQALNLENLFEAKKVRYGSVSSYRVNVMFRYFITFLLIHLSFGNYIFIMILL
jgi:hypothetical protein